MSTEIAQLARVLENQQLSPGEVADRTSTVGRFLMQSSGQLGEANFKSIGCNDLKLLFHFTDEVYLGGRLDRAYREITGEPLEFRLSKRMITTGGTTTMFRVRQEQGDRLARGAKFEIAIATTPLFQTFGDEGSALVSGVTCRNRLEALQRVMEHEMIHLAEFVCWDDSNCHQQRFRSIVHRCFGHRESTHQLLNHRSNAKLLKGISVGDQVAFQNGPVLLRGRVNRITKRASVLVPDKRGRRFNDGERYATYYVPIPLLKKVS